MKRWRILLLSAWGSLVLSQTFVPQTPKEIERQIEIAKELLSYNEYHEAIEELLPVYKIKPKDPEVLYLLGRALLGAGHNQEALSYLEYVVNNLPQNFEDTIPLLWYYANALLINEKPEEAEHYFKRFQKALNSIKDEKPSVYKKYQKRYPLELELHWCENAKKYLKEPKEVVIKNLGPIVNSRYPDYAPVLNAKEDMLIFTTRRPTNLGPRYHDGFFPEDIYISYKRNGHWTKPEPIHAVNTKHHDASVSLSADGKRLYIYRYENRGGDIYESEFVNGHWTTPKRLPKPLNTKYWEPSAYESPDGKILFIVSDRPGGLGGTDIYWCKKLPNGQWSEPKNIGPPINTPYNEESPILLADGKTLMFISDGPHSMGGFDVFKSVLQEDSTWSEPENLGYPINTPGDDIYVMFSPDGRRAYFASERKDSYGDQDIYLIDLYPPKPLPTLTTKAEELGVEPTLIKPRFLKINVYDRVTRKPLKAKLFVQGQPDTIEATFYQMEIVPGEAYKVWAAHPTHFSHEEIIKVPEKDTTEVYEYDLYLSPIPTIHANVVEIIHFDFDRFDIRPSEIPKLQRAVEILKKSPHVKIVLAGHTDVRGPLGYNEILSKRRAESVRDYLVSKGIDPNRIQIEYYGERRPKDLSGTEEGHQMNRRVEIVLLNE